MDPTSTAHMNHEQELPVRATHACGTGWRIKNNSIMSIDQPRTSLQKQ